MNPMTTAAEEEAFRQIKQQVSVGLLPPIALKTAPTFERTANKTLDECRATYTQRGQEYLDSWHIDNQHTLFLDSVIESIHKSNDLPIQYTSEEKRLIVLASMIDVKLSRMIGPWKKDTAVDLINYLASFTALREEYGNGG